MAAACAACLKPIDKGEKFVLAGTEVFHRQCAAAGGVQSSVLTNAKLEIANLRRALASAEYERATTLRNIEYARTKMQSLEQRVSDAEHRVQARTTTAEEAAAFARQEASRAHERILELQDQLASARREVELLRTLSPSAPTGTAQSLAQADPQRPQEDKDASEIRFGLLELDIPK